MKMFDEYNPMFLLIGGLVLWYFIGMLTNSISESKKPNGGVKKNKTKYSNKNRTPAKHIKEKRKSTNLVFIYVMECINFFLNLFNVFIMVILPFFFWCLSMWKPLIILSILIVIFL